MESKEETNLALMSNFLKILTVISVAKEIMVRLTQNLPSNLGQNDRALIMRFKAKIFQKSIHNNKRNKFWSMEITTKTFALKYAKLFKITGQTSVATKAGKRLTIK